MILKNFKTILFGFLILLAIGCSEHKDNLIDIMPLANAQIIARDNWLVSGKMLQPEYANGEVMAFGINGESYQTHINNYLFGIELPPKSSFALYFLPELKILNDETNDETKKQKKEITPDTLISHLTFEESPDIGKRETLRLPEISGTGILNLGEVVIKGEFAIPSNNPAAIFDYDKDKKPDIRDTDDQNDGILDKGQNDLIESVGICHQPLNTDEEPKNLLINLRSLLPHIVHGDYIGQCAF